MNKFRLLRADEIECRIAQVKENGLSLLLYKTARTDANLLDETVGVENWENDFKVVDGVLYGGIGIYDEHKDRWNWKWDAGTESNTEAEKGRASDAFKRSGFKHGIGRELYSAPFVWVTSDKCEIKGDQRGYKCYDRFSVTDIGYDNNQDINRLVIMNEKKGVVAFSMGVKNYRNTKSETPKVKEEPKEEKPKEQKAKGDPKLKISLEDLAYITSEATQEEIQMILSAYRVDMIENLTDDQAKKTIRAINKRKADAGNVL